MPDDVQFPQPNPDWVTLVASGIRATLYVLGTFGFTWAYAVTGSQITMIATALAVVGSFVWSIWQKYAAHSTLVAAAKLSATKRTPVAPAPPPIPPAILLAFALSATLFACAPPPVPVTSAVTPTLTPSSVCADIAAVAAAPDANAALSQLDPHSALGVLWADAKAGCSTVGVDPSWTTQVWTWAKGLIPVVLPYIVPAIASLL